MYDVMATTRVGRSRRDIRAAKEEDEELYWSPDRHRTIDREELLELVPALERRDPKDAYLFYDCQTDDVRLVLTVLGEAERFGATMLNGAEVTEVLTRGGRACGVACVEAGSGERFEVEAENVVNATGVWADRIRSEIIEEEDVPRIAPSRGTHLLLDRDDLSTGSAACIVPAGEGRAIFALPWYGRTLVGTTDNDFDGDIDHPHPADDDIEYLLEAVNAFFGASLGAADLVGAYAGVRPLISTGDPKKSVDISRKAELYETSSGMLTITGGKLTTWRRMAKQTVDRLVERGAREAPCHTAEIPLGMEARAADLEAPPGSGRTPSPSSPSATATRRATCWRSPPSSRSWRRRSSPAAPTCWRRRRSPPATSRRAVSPTCCCAGPGSACWRRRSCATRPRCDRWRRRLAPSSAGRAARSSARPRPGRPPRPRPASTPPRRRRSSPFNNLPPVNKSELESKHLGELHALAAEAGVERYRMLPRAELIEKLAGGGGNGSAKPQGERGGREPGRRKRSGGGDRSRGGGERRRDGGDRPRGERRERKPRGESKPRQEPKGEPREEKPQPPEAAPAAAPSARSANAAAAGAAAARAVSAPMTCCCRPRPAVAQSSTPRAAPPAPRCCASSPPSWPASRRGPTRSPC